MIRPWMMWAFMITVLCAMWAYAGYLVCDLQWTQRDTERKLGDAKAAVQLSEEYRAKERKLNETIGEIETRAINDSAAAEMELKAVTDRLLNPGRHPGNGLRVKPALTCRAVPNNPATSSNGHEEVQSGLSPEIAGSAVGVGAECDQVVLSLQACQDYAASLQK